MSMDKSEKIMHLFNDDICASVIAAHDLYPWYPDAQPLCFNEEEALNASRLEMNECFLRGKAAQDNFNFTSALRVSECFSGFSVIKEWSTKSVRHANEWKNILAEATSASLMVETDLMTMSFKTSLPWFYKIYLQEVLKIEKKAQNQLEQLVVSEPNSMLYRRNLGVAMKIIGDIYREGDDFTIAHDYYERAINILEPLIDAQNDDFDISWELFDLYTKLLHKNKSNIEFIHTTHSVYSLFRKKIMNNQNQQQHFSVQTKIQNTLNKEYYGKILTYFSVFHVLLGNHEEAFSLSSYSIKLFANSPLSKIVYAHSLLFTNRYEEAKKIYMENPQQIVRDGKKFYEVVLMHFNEFKERGNNNQDMAKIEELYKSRANP